MLGFSLLILGFLLIFQEIHKRSADSPKDTRTDRIKFGKNEKQIALTILNGFMYAVLFNPLGYVLSTIIFLMSELFIFDGFKVWKKAAVISIIFSAIAYTLFDPVLGIYLPKSPLGIF